MITMMLEPLTFHTYSIFENNVFLVTLITVTERIFNLEEHFSYVTISLEGLYKRLYRFEIQ